MGFSTKRPRIFYIQLRFQEQYPPLLLSQALGKTAKCKQPRGLYVPQPELSPSHPSPKMTRHLLLRVLYPRLVDFIQKSSRFSDHMTQVME